MTSPTQNGTPGGHPHTAEDTLRLIAALPAPEGLADRVHARLRTASRTGGLFSWAFAPVAGYRLHSPMFRGAAAAAIVCLVAGGGWQICTHVQPPATANNWVQPARVGNSGGFSNAGAMRTPDTLDRPVLTHAVQPAPDASAASPAGQGIKPAKKHKTIKGAVMPAQPHP